MTGTPETDRLCGICGGRLEFGEATIPFVFPQTVVIVKNVPAEICAGCHEPFMSGKVTDRLTEVLARLRSLQTEVAIVSYQDLAASTAT